MALEEMALQQEFEKNNYYSIKEDENKMKHIKPLNYNQNYSNVIDMTVAELIDMNACAHIKCDNCMFYLEDISKLKNINNSSALCAINLIESVVEFEKERDA